jgi:branched-subunit amino acid transport protein
LNYLMIAGMAAVTYASRALPMVVGGTPRAAVGRYLRLVPVAIFAALIVPGLAAPDGELSLGPELVAGAVGLAVAMVTRNVFATLGAGYVVFMALEGLN